MKFLNYLIITKIILIFGMNFFTKKSFAQEDSSLLCLMDMIRLKTSYESVSDLSFNVKFSSSEKDSTGLYITDSVNGSYKIHGHNFWSSVDSVTQVQNEQYTLTIYPDEKMLLVQKPDYVLGTILSKDFLDTAFQQLDVSGISIISKGGSQKELSMHFKPESLYLSYDMYYDTATYLLSKFEYKLKENTDYLKISILFTDYDSSPIEDAIFNTDPYFTKIGTEYSPTSEYSDYELIDPLSNLWNEPS